MRGPQRITSFLLLTYASTQNTVGKRTIVVMRVQANIVGFDLSFTTADPK